MEGYGTDNCHSTEKNEKRVPRAEFRVFGQGILDIIQPAMWNAQAKLFKTRQSAEIYILSSWTNEVNVKIRYGLLDIKVKIGETESGYEIFEPGGKFQFPVGSNELARIMDQLQGPVQLSRESYSLNQFLATVKVTEGMVSVKTNKERYGFTVDGVICEYAKVLFNGAMVETACVESEKYQDMEQVIDKLGIRDLENVNYLKAAKRVVGME